MRKVNTALNKRTTIFNNCFIAFSYFQQTSFPFTKVIILIKFVNFDVVNGQGKSENIKKFLLVLLTALFLKEQKKLNMNKEKQKLEKMLFNELKMNKLKIISDRSQDIEQKIDEKISAFLSEAQN